MKENSSGYFANTRCEFFPCHEGADPDNFNCLFCYCPLYALGEDCGGGFCYTESGVKDCSHCLLPHLPDGAERVRELFPKISALAGRKAPDDK